MAQRMKGLRGDGRGRDGAYLGIFEGSSFSCIGSSNPAIRVVLVELQRRLVKE